MNGGGNHPQIVSVTPNSRPYLQLACLPPSSQDGGNLIQWEIIEDNNFVFADFTAALKINSLKSYIQPCSDILLRVKFKKNLP